MNNQVNNRLLSSLSVESYEQFASDLESVSLAQGTVLHYSGEIIRDVYFPLTCLISITTTMKNGVTTETGVVGNREMVGINAFMGGWETTQTDYIVQIPGDALKMNAQRLRQEFHHNKELQTVLLRYTQAFIAQISQTTACNSLHQLEQRFARWLLESQTRIESDQINLTQEFIANMIGVRRAGVTQAAQKLQDQGLIKYSRGKIKILNQQGLEATACECFQLVNTEYNRLLNDKQTN